MKSLKPTMREKKRYLLVRGKDLKANVEKAILEFVGVLGMSKAGLVWIKSGSSSAIISVNRGAVDSVRGSLCAFSEKMVVEKVSGTLKGLRGK
ncbi:hypothetical protein GOV13_05490 [Candidatus Pacearchaeota archaeon]|nr:hypothetical protein [Candidatus Pacearchaeota archaeon]